MRTINIEKNFSELINRIRTLLKDRPGVEALTRYMEEKTDIKTAPHSRDKILSEAGGCVAYALTLHDTLRSMLQTEPWSQFVHGIQTQKRTLQVTEENLAVISLLGTLDNAHLFAQEVRNQKTYDKDKISAAHDTGLGHLIKRDANGDYMWETAPAYVYDDKLPLGGGVKAIALATAYIKITADEMMALRWGRHNPTGMQERAAMFNAYKMSPLTTMLHNARMTVDFVSGIDGITQRREPSAVLPEKPKPEGANDIPSLPEEKQEASDSPNLIPLLNPESNTR